MNIITKDPTHGGRPRQNAGRINHRQPTDSLSPRIWLNRSTIIRGIVSRLIVQALIDLQLFAAGRNKSKQASKVARQNAAAALLWLNGQFSAQRITFAECCDMMGFIPEESREKLLAQVDPAALLELGHVTSHAPVNRIKASNLCSPGRSKSASSILSRQGRRRSIPSRN